MTLTWSKAEGLPEADKQRIGRLFKEMKPINHKSDGIHEISSSSYSTGVIVGVPLGKSRFEYFKRHIMIEVPPQKNILSEYKEFLHNIERFKMMSRMFTHMLFECGVLSYDGTKMLNEYYDLFVSEELMPEAKELKIKNEQHE